jgi:hypothetical protein
MQSVIPTRDMFQQLRSESITFDKYFIVALDGQIQFKSPDSRMQFEPFNHGEIVSQEPWILTQAVEPCVNTQKY